MPKSTENPSFDRLGGASPSTGVKPEASMPEGAWIQSMPAWRESNSQHLWIAAGAGLGVLACLALAGALFERFSGSAANDSCASGEECNARGAALSQPADASEEQLTRAARLFQRGCDQGSATACNNLGLAHQGGRGLPIDHARALAAFQRACSAGFAEGCSNEGALHEHGLGVPVNLGDAQRLYFQACRRGSALGCSNLGALYASGRGVLTDETEAARFFGEACSRGSDVGCANLFESERAASARDAL